MTYLKATAVGIVTAVIFGAAWMWAALQLPIWWQMWQQRNQGGRVGTRQPFAFANARAFSTCRATDFASASAPFCSVLLRA
jgi:hypothetical protein